MNGPRQARRGAGFSLLELVLTIAIIVLLGMLLGPKLMNAYPKVAVESEGIRLRSDLAYAQQLAISSSSIHRVIFDTVNDRIIIYHVKGANLTLVSQRDLANSVNLAHSTFTNGYVEFNMLGEPSQGGQVTLNGARGTTIRVTVKAGTGLASVSS